MVGVRERMIELVNLAAPFWAGEAEIVRSYLTRPRTSDTDLRWLKAQAFKETRHLRILPRRVQDEYWRTGTVRNHPQGSEAGAKLAEEMKHFRLIAELIEFLTVTPVGMTDLLELPEETALQDLRQPYRGGTNFERCIVDFTEGGGGAMYWVLARVEGGDFERRTASAFRLIYDDEVLHGPGQIHTIGRLANSAADWEHAEDIVARVCAQRLRMRNEMFSWPVSVERIAAIGAGNIDPWPMPVAV
ncbi:MAG TPA: hypothetical protein VN812_00195 [Candidatus Acidoferrales bacterium]|nr:hypothetical protein [Candidatus Acidoferrales bacterium]